MVDGPTVARSLVRRARRVLRPAPRLDSYAPRSTLELPGSEVLAAAVPAVDVHNHLGRWLHRSGGWMAPDVGALIADLDSCNVATAVNLDGRWGTELEENLDRYDRRHPDRFATFCHVDWSLLNQPGGSGLLAQSLRDSVAAGARGLKVWKDLGLTVRDVDGRLVLPDDPRLAELWQAAGELGVPVLIHVADPAAFFDPVDRHNERLEELLRSRVSWAAAGRSGRRRLLDALEAIVAGHPRTRWVAAHVAGDAENLARVSGLLTRYPNLTVDIAARLGDLGRQPRATGRLVREHPDRIVFGTDVFPFRPAEARLYFRFLETEDEYFGYSTADTPPSGRWQISGLGLEPEILRMVYRENALRLLATS